MKINNYKSYKITILAISISVCLLSFLLYILTSNIDATSPFNIIEPITKPALIVSLIGSLLIYFLIKNPVDTRELQFAVLIGFVNVLISILVDAYFGELAIEQRLNGIYNLVLYLWILLNFIPFFFAFVSVNMHDFNIYVLHFTVFVQWFLLTLYFFRFKRRLRE
jgi:hypothetical protein